LFGARKNRGQAADASTQAAESSEQPAESSEQAPDSATPRSRRGGILLTAGAVVLVVVAGGLTWLFVSGRMGSPSASAAVRTQHARQAAKPTGPFRILSLTPAPATHHVNGAAPVQITFSAPLAASSPTPGITPAVRGSWTTKGSTMVFTPATSFGLHATITVHVPAGQSGVRSATGSVLAAPVTDQFQTKLSYSTLRLQQLLAQLGYLPLTWAPSAAAPAPGTTNAQLSAAFEPPAGTFSWQGGYPAALTSQWVPGQPNLVQAGAIRAFEYQHGLTMDGTAGPAVWRALLRAAAGGATNSAGYTYALASKANPETLTIWHNGHVVLHTLANTGISVAPTAAGTFPVYIRYAFQIMRGTNPDGSKYADPVQNVAYFNGGDAVHYFPRSSFGYPQSLGCVELPLAQSAVAYRYLTYGSLVTVR
jgi:peptidoglycan hydrolase-like protein with peptidoglycan-binding domain